VYIYFELLHVINSETTSVRGSLLYTTLRWGESDVQYRHTAGTCLPLTTQQDLASFNKTDHQGRDFETLKFHMLLYVPGVHKTQAHVFWTDLDSVKPRSAAYNLRSNATTIQKAISAFNADVTLPCKIQDKIIPPHSSIITKVGCDSKGVLCRNYTCDSLNSTVK
jgi:hypothetical protein